jgi:hypothetical protein
MDNGRILVDANSSIPPLVQALITDTDPSVRIVSESPVNAKRFYASMLEAAGFYSVEKNFSLDFGSDPKLTMNFDFKIEKTAESIINQDIALLNTERVPLSPALNNFLKKEGYTLYEPFASLQPVVPDVPRSLYQIKTKNQSEIVKALLASLSVTSDHDRQLDVFETDNNGILLSVKADQYFERGGQRLVVTQFDGNPVTYTLFRILETKGYRVIILDPQDDFRKISEKMFSRMQIRNSYGQHTMTPESRSNYSLKMSGYALEGAGLPVGGLFLTNLELDSLIRDVLTENGYSITTK